MVFPDYFSDGIRLYNSEVVPVGTSNGATLGRIDKTLLVFSYYLKLVK